MSYLSVDFGEHGGQMEWASHEELAEWIEKLQSDWSWVWEYLKDYSSCRENWAKKISRPLFSLSSAIQQANQGDAADAASQLTSAEYNLKKLIQPHPWLLPNRHERLFLERCRNAGNEKEAALIAAYWIESDLRGVPAQELINAILTWKLYERGIDGRVESESDALKNLFGEMQTKLTALQVSERNQAEGFEKLHAHLSEQQSTYQSAFESSQNGRDEEWRERLTTMQSEFNQLKETYDTHMALSAPAEYWEKKRKSHRNLAWISFIAMLLCMGVVGYFLHGEILVLSTLESPTAWRFGTLLLLATLGFWLIRIAVRIFLSNLHLENDAAERITMMSAYLALLRDDGLSKDGSIGTVLAALFRPSGDGIVKDEGLPPTAMEWMTRLGGGK